MVLDQHEALGLFYDLAKVPDDLLALGGEVLVRVAELGVVGEGGERDVDLGVCRKLSVCKGYTEFGQPMRAGPAPGDIPW